MFEKYIRSVRTESPGDEAIGGTRERLRDTLPRAAARRMTQLGMLMSSVLADAQLREDDVVVYASQYGESHALEEYLASFPAASPTLFQTSIHPSAVQQAMIAKQQALREFWPHTGGEFLVAQALRSALLAPGERCVFCGGEERGTWLREHQVASADTFAFALVLQGSADESVGKIRLGPGLEPGAEKSTGLALHDFFLKLRERRPLQCAAAPASLLEILWH